jgi:hypothetical protein
LGLATLVVKASFPFSDQNLCALPGASCTSNPLTFNRQEVVAVCCTDGVQLFGIDGTGPLATAGTGASGISAFTFDGQGNLFVATAGSIDEYAPPYANVAATISSGVASPSAIAVGDDGNLFVANAGANPQSVTAYLPPYAHASPSATITDSIELPGPPGNGAQLAIENGTNVQQPILLVANSGGVNEYAYPYAAAPTALRNAVDGAAIGPGGVLYALTAGGPAFCTFGYGCNSPFGSAGNAYTITVPHPANVAATPFAFVAASDGNVYAFNPNNATPLTLTGGFSGLPQLLPANIATDPNGNLAVVDYQHNAVVIHTGASAKGTSIPSFAGTVTLTQSIHWPSQVQILP